MVTATFRKVILLSSLALFTMTGVACTTTNPTKSTSSISEPDDGVHYGRLEDDFETNEWLLDQKGPSLHEAIAGSNYRDPYEWEGQSSSKPKVTAPKKRNNASVSGAKSPKRKTQAKQPPQKKAPKRATAPGRSSR